MGVGRRYIVNVEAAIVRDGRYLLTIRGQSEDHAPGTLSLPGGKVESAASSDGILEATLRREVLEEVGVEVDERMAYVESKTFVDDVGTPVVDVVFLSPYRSGTAAPLDPDEVAEILWLTAEEVAHLPRTPPWTRQSIARAERRRLVDGW